MIKLGQPQRPTTRTFTGALSGSLTYEGDSESVQEYLKKHPDMEEVDYFAGDDFFDPNNDDDDEQARPRLRVKRQSKGPGVGHVIGTSPLQVEFVVNYKEKDHETWFSPPNSNIVYASKDVQKVRKTKYSVVLRSSIQGTTNNYVFNL
jgi:hypothetical protein